MEALDCIKIDRVGRSINRIESYINDVKANISDLERDLTDLHNDYMDMVDNGCNEDDYGEKYSERLYQDLYDLEKILVDLIENADLAKYKVVNAYDEVGEL